MTIVTNVQFNHVSFLFQIYINPAGFGMFGNVTKRFLAHAVEGYLYFGGEDDLP